MVDAQLFWSFFRCWLRFFFFHSAINSDPTAAEDGVDTGKVRQIPPLPRLWITTAKKESFIARGEIEVLLPTIECFTLIEGERRRRKCAVKACVTATDRLLPRCLYTFLHAAPLICLSLSLSFMLHTFDFPLSLSLSLFGMESIEEEAVTAAATVEAAAANPGSIRSCHCPLRHRAFFPSTSRTFPHSKRELTVPMAAELAGWLDLSERAQLLLLLSRVSSP